MAIMAALVDKMYLGSTGLYFALGQFSAWAVVCRGSCLSGQLFAYAVVNTLACR